MTTPPTHQKPEEQCQCLCHKGFDNCMVCDCRKPANSNQQPEWEKELKAKVKEILKANFDPNHTPVYDLYGIGPIDIKIKVVTEIITDIFRSFFSSHQQELIAELTKTRDYAITCWKESKNKKEYWKGIVDGYDDVISLLQKKP